VCGFKNRPTPRKSYASPGFRSAVHNLTQLFRAGEGEFDPGPPQAPQVLPPLEQKTEKLPKKWKKARKKVAKMGQKPGKNAKKSKKIEPVFHQISHKCPGNFAISRRDTAVFCVLPPGNSAAEI